MASEMPVTVEPGKETIEVTERGQLRLLLAAMRPHQWLKNLFVFAPLLFGKRIADPVAVGNAVLAFAVFCLLASALYIFNDWIDLEEDRNHPEKCKRPLSSGLLSIPVALSVSALLALMALAIATTLGSEFMLIAAGYALLTVSYCLVLKSLIVIDAMTISAGFVLRVVGGAAAAGVFASHWLIACTFLLAMFLSFSKRRQELLTLSKASDHRKVLEEYSETFLVRVNSILIGASIVCYALYTVAPETIEKFGTDTLIYGTAFVIYGMLRYMILIEDTSNGGNPSKMLLKDRPLQLTVAGWVIFNALVVYHINILEFLVFLAARIL